MTDYCFDVTAELGEQPVELIIGTIRSEVVLCGVRKSLSRGEHIAAMWEVKNGLHLKNTISLMSAPADKGESLLDGLWLLFGQDNTNLTEIMLERSRFSGSGQFWEKISSHGLSHVVSRSRLSSKMREKLKTEAERLVEKRL